MHFRYELFLLLKLLAASLSAQAMYEPIAKNCITGGIMEGGGAFIGIDYERLILDRVGMQAGCGVIGSPSLGAGINIHWQPDLTSPCIGLQYWQQGIRESFYQNAIGPCIVYRAPKWFTCQIGYGYRLNTGPVFIPERSSSKYVFTFALGVYSIW